MSYNDSAFYLAETNRKNHLKAPLKPFVGVLAGRNVPSYRRDDNFLDRSISGSTASRSACRTNTMSMVTFVPRKISFGGNSGVIANHIHLVLLLSSLVAYYNTYTFRRFAQGFEGDVNLSR